MFGVQLHAQLCGAVRPTQARAACSSSMLIPAQRAAPGWGAEPGGLASSRSVQQPSKHNGGLGPQRGGIASLCAVWPIGEGQHAALQPQLLLVCSSGSLCLIGSVLPALLFLRPLVLG